MMENNVPESWVEIQLEELLISLESGSRPKGGVRGIVKGIPSIGGEHLNNNGGFDFENIKYVPEEFAQKMKRGQIKINDVLIVKDGATTGKISYVNHNFQYKHAVVNEHVFICRASKEIPSKYLYYFLRSNEGNNRILENFKGSAQGGINTGFVSNTLIPLSPLPEQYRIVAKLDALIQKVESNRQRLDKIPKLLKRFRQSVLAAAVSGRLTEVWRQENGIVEEWEEKRIDTLFKVRTGLTPLRSNEAYFKNGTIPWVKTGEVKNSDIIEIEERITQKAIDETKIKIFPVNTLLIAMYGEGKTRGSIGRLKIPAATNQACAALINEEIDFTTNQYVFFFLLSQYEEMRRAAVGGVRPNLNLDKVKSILVFLPSLEEQQEIVSRVEQLFAFSDKIEARYTKAKAMLDKLPQSILAKAFRGELVTQDPNDEPAERLLERIRAMKKGMK